MLNKVFVLTERDPEDGQILIIGVADSLENADKLMLDYYRQFTVTRFKDVRDSGIEWYKDVELTDINGYTYKYTCTLQSFTINIS
jgi:hypothetical protein